EKTPFDLGGELHGHHRDGKQHRGDDRRDETAWNDRRGGGILAHSRLLDDVEATACNRTPRATVEIRWRIRGRQAGAVRPRLHAHLARVDCRQAPDRATFSYNNPSRKRKDP